MERENNKEAINAAINLLHTKWVMRIIWELREGSMTFRQLRQACDDVSPTSLNKRLGELREFKIVEHHNSQGYELTALGKSLLIVTTPLIDWAVEWWNNE